MCELILQQIHMHLSLVLPRTSSYNPHALRLCSEAFGSAWPGFDMF